ncbi:hypothetical protein RP20_CCG026743 [Aedes albopictus]|nr:hypothetical protein RP20_CCG026743 [Aedes albopictus]
MSSMVNIFNQGSRVTLASGATGSNGFQSTGLYWHNQGSNTGLEPSKHTVASISGAWAPWSLFPAKVAGLPGIQSNGLQRYPEQRLQWFT